MPEVFYSVASGRTLLQVYFGKTSLQAGHLITHTGRPHELLMTSVRYLYMYPYMLQQGR